MLNIACRKDNVSLFKSLINHYPNDKSTMEMINISHYMVLACQLNAVQLVTWLQRKHCKGRLNLLALQTACDCNNWKVLGVLLNEDSAVMSDDNKDEILYELCTRSVAKGHIRVTKILLSETSEDFIYRDNLYNLIVIAMKNGHRNMMHYLATWGEDIFEKEHLRLHPLQYFRDIKYKINNRDAFWIYVNYVIPKYYGRGLDLIRP